MIKQIVIFVLLNLNLSLSANLFLQKPQTISSEQIDQIVQQAQSSDLHFSWIFNKACCLTFFQSTGQHGFMFRVGGLPVYGCNLLNINNLKKACVYLKNKIQNRGSGQAKSYFYAQPLKFENPEPYKITLEELKNLLENKNFIFYTGAGLSAAASIPTMPILERSLKMDQGAKKLAQALLLQPKILAQAFGDFCNIAFQAQPTPAHFAISQIAQNKSLAILTENVDLLHHRTGSVPINMHGDEIYNATTSDFQAIDFLICIGLSRDDCGFMAYYKRQNPNGKIIALDLNTPNYLSSEDYLLQDDLQVILPQMAQKI